VFARGDRTVVALNFSDAPATVAGVGPGEIDISTDRSRDTQRVDADLELAPWEGVILEK
jgi:hypothetical protein